MMTLDRLRLLFEAGDLLAAEIVTDPRRNPAPLPVGVASFVAGTGRGSAWP